MPTIKKLLRGRFPMLTVFTGAVLAFSAYRFYYPDDAASGLEAAPGLEVKVFAAEPLLLNPTNIDIDEKGRVWVCEAINYRPVQNPANPKRPEGDRILILEDNDGDGRADKQKVFYQGNDVNAALGICVLGNKAIVSVSPNVFIFTDTDGDDKADKKELLFTGIDGEQHDHAVHAFSFGPDGKLYFNFGNEGKNIKDKNGEPLKDRLGNVIADNGKPYRQGMVFRCNMDGSDIEVLGNNFRNNYEVAVDSYGTLWQSDNDDDGNRGVRINYVMQYGNYGYQDEMTGAGWRAPRANMETEIPLRHWHLNDPGVVPNLLQTGAGSPTGILLYEGDLLPEVFRNQVIHSDAGPNVVRAYPVKPDGAGYKAELVNILTTKDDKWFRPSDVGIAPDGSLIVADWYDPGVGGHRMQDVNKGRLFRVAPPGTPYKVPAPDLKSAEGALHALNSPNLATRYLGWTKLNSLGKKAEKVLARQFQTDANPRFRARACWLLSKLEAKKAKKYIGLAVADANADIRITGLRAAMELKMDVNPLLNKLASDPSPQVRREVAVQLRFNTTAEAPAIWTRLANQYDGNDRWYLEALGIGAGLQWDKCFNTWYQQTDRNMAKKATRDITWRARTPAAMALLPGLISDPLVPAAELPRYFRAFDFYPESPGKQLLLTGLLNGGGARNTQINMLALAQISPESAGQPQVQAALQQVLEANKGKIEFIEMVNRFKIRNQDAGLLNMALTQPSSPIGMEAAKSLLAGNPDLLEKNINGSDESATAIFTALGTFGDLKTLKWMETVSTNPARNMRVRQSAIKTMGMSRTGEDRILAMVKKKNMEPGLQQASASVLFRASRPAIREEAAQYITNPSKEGKPLAPIDKLAVLSGNAVNGKAVFAASCLVCHKVNTAGSLFGPELSEIGNKLPKIALYDAILNPSAGISFGYEGYVVKLKNGTTVEGIIASETNDKLDVRFPGGAVISYPKADVVSKSLSGSSPMPSNLQQGMTQQELVDLVEYLTTLKKVGN
ncbi:PVC-type heme-binding CxxCH protein [Hufsiella ginkgonis]|uniref:C-type cytochrome n=1 Tax=Hufsiella ginkgonis TaxID=2695274 RepID=A0A7K1Y1E9_9SPHI|nr:PVC-type heme-binding CxxCH protein [Hufsiella ginkgonis]MXV17074.1 c-type cytochrome [Hufsiella ginkgonis]